MKSYGNKLSADKVSANKFVGDFTEKVSDENLSPEQLFRGRSVLDKSSTEEFCQSEEATPFNVKEAKERITILLCRRNLKM